MPDNKERMTNYRACIDLMKTSGPVDVTKIFSHGDFQIFLQYRSMEDI